MLEKQMSVDSEFSSSDSWTTGESSQRSSDLGRGYSSGESSCSCQCVATLSGHSGPVSSLVVIGNRIYSGGSDGRDIRVWNQPEMTEICRFGSGDGAVKALILIGDRLFSAHQDMKIRAWRQPGSEHGPKGPKGPKLVATLPTMKDYLLRCIPSKNYVQVRRHKTSLWIQHNDAISVLAVGPGNLLYSGSWDKTIKVWRTSDFRCLESITGHHDAVSSLVADQQGFLFSASADATVKMWIKCGNKHSLVTTLSKHKSSVNALALSPDESLLYAASSDKTISIWERTKGGEVEHMTFMGLLKGHRQAVLCIAAVGDIVCTGSADKTIHVWMRSGTDHSLVTVLEGHRGAVRSICASLEAVELGLMIYSGSIDRSVKLWWLAPSQDNCASSPAGSSPPLLLKWRPRVNDIPLPP